ncbi:hypothetical protein MYSTI_07051 [Myxococcus stipitatus DSM 14675]|uniref:Uncharacterized protein n=1 Tax=Myxococcus stipitatus (strain DSM 14675 / JCM 12634 / Mx s8) TaxID=1278073 RepID=L7UJZ6_MYXSD|nr:hypothetical protein [Myxococcus stipitatus]AGC48323.1 hypothetical protein MYSTI_07051 [Myxococcus stipitatus DSM 14675]
MAVPILKVLQLMEAKDLRALAASRKVSERHSESEVRHALSASFGESMQRLIDALDRETLYRLLRRPFRWRERRYFSPELARHSKDQLVALARAIFVQGEVPPEFGKESTHSEFNLDEYRVTSGSVAADALKNVAAHGAEDDDDSGRTVVAPAMQYLIGLSREWSRPRNLSGVLRALGMEVPERLRSSRFQEAVRKLIALGIDISEADSGRVYSPRDSSPGVDGKVRLRRARS